ncbi:GtrA family protein [Patescibacteria group bacterium]|nr:GtrA family protein [Patescibacteria group bacterium]
MLSLVFGMKPQIATLISAEAGNISNFFINDNWTFKKIRQGKWYIRILKYHFSVLIGYIIAKVLLFEYVYKLTLSFVTNSVYAILIANTIVIFIGAVVNFTINIIWTWKFKEHSEVIESSIEDYEN